MEVLHVYFRGSGGFRSEFGAHGSAVSSRLARLLAANALGREVAARESLPSSARATGQPTLLTTGR
jgi:hypothetical protein